MTRILLVDNYDSFVYNIAQCLGALGASVIVERNDSPKVRDYLGQVDGYVISPGPGHPKSSNQSLEILKNDGYGRPVLGVCLGHQAIGYLHGGSIIRAGQVVHGKVSKISHSGGSLFEGVPEQFLATRYHSLLIDKNEFPASLEILAETDSKEIMAIKVRGKAIYGVQFHPESIMTSHGKRILSNFLGMCAR
jgi:anthranilate synthase/aminodeoxychorismate synthase-like glutamine amidotransferase